MISVFIIPTGVGARIGGHAGDATPALKTITAISDLVITHPNVVNASAINEMPSNALYVEGSMLDKFLENKIGLKEVKSNRILVVVNSPAPAYAINIVSAARATCGLVASVLELNTPLVMKGWVDENNKATGSASGVNELINEVSSYDFDALAILTPIDTEPGVAKQYFEQGGTNPWGGIEAQVSRAISHALHKPVAHAPLEAEATYSDPDLLFIADKQIIDPRIASEAISGNYGHCVLKGLHKAPRMGNGLSFEDVDCLISPYGCIGRPHMACFDAGIPVIVVSENTTCGQDRDNRSIVVKNYLEAAGVVAAIKAGVDIKTVLDIPKTSLKNNLLETSNEF